MVWRPVEPPAHLAAVASSFQHAQLRAALAALRGSNIEANGTNARRRDALAADAAAPYLDGVSFAATLAIRRGRRAARTRP